MKFFFLCMLASFSLYAEMTDKATGLTFPEHVTFNFEGKDYQLTATGVATRKKFMFKVYSVAHYLQEGGQTKEILNDHFAKQLTIKWARNVPASKIQEGYQESLGDTQGDAGKFISFFNQDAKAGDEYILRWIPEGNLEVLINGSEVGMIKNGAFAKRVWEIWFGSKNIVDKNALMSFIKS